MTIIQFIGGGELVIVFLAILLLFGSKQIPEFARTMGKGLREFKKATDEIKREINEETKGIGDDINDMRGSLKS
ncbi:MAG: twin-arginine translocase TatA/TatE family subunit [Bacteroidota bacterium]|nr:MAG: twin-arginine translocase TatA/TatE family subunit [Bacteroidota bacterium]